MHLTHARDHQYSVPEREGERKKESEKESQKELLFSRKSCLQNERTVRHLMVCRHLHFLTVGWHATFRLGSPRNTCMRGRLGLHTFPCTDLFKGASPARQMRKDTMKCRPSGIHHSLKAPLQRFRLVMGSPFLICSPSTHHHAEEKGSLACENLSHHVLGCIYRRSASLLFTLIHVSCCCRPLGGGPCRAGYVSA